MARRVLIASYGNVLVPELIKMLDAKENCIFVMFNTSTEIRLVQKALGKKRIVPILNGDSCEVKGHSQTDNVIRALPEMDAVINLDNCEAIEKFYEKRKRFRTTEMKLQKVTASEIKAFIESSEEKCLLNLLPESTIGLKHMFDSEGLEVPIHTHISASVQNSVRKLFKKVSKAEISEVDYISPSAGRSTPISTKVTPEPRTVKKFRHLSIFKKKKPLTQSQSDTGAVADPDLELRHKENLKYKKTLNKLHLAGAQRLAKQFKKLDVGKVKDQHSVEKVIEEEARLEKGRLESKCNNLNAETFSRSSALTQETANKIVASREARMNKEVYRNANKKKIAEFERIEDTYNSKVSQVRIKEMEKMIKTQFQKLEGIRVKNEQRWEKKSVQRMKTIG